MSTLKCLQLHHWMTSSWMCEETLKHYKPLPAYSPRRPGIYLCGSQSMFVLEDGRAFEYDSKQFRYELAVMQAGELDHRKVQALAAVVAQRMATKQQRELLRKCQDAAALREVARSATLRHMSILKAHQ